MKVSVSKWVNFASVTDTSILMLESITNISSESKCIGDSIACDSDIRY